jgi:hypothetical protein
MPFEKLPEKTHTFARMIMSMIEEADEEASQVMSQAQKEEFIHSGMDLEFLLRRNPAWRTVFRNILFTKGDLVEMRG